MLKQVIIIFFFLFSASQVYAQITIQGQVRDSLNAAIPYTVILLQETDSEQIITYTQGDSDGFYSFQTQVTEDVKLVVTAMSFEKSEIVLQLSGKQNETINQDVILKHNPIQVKEINIKASQPISVRGDTISYNVDDFMVGDEMVVEDVLKNLPGVEVNEEGKVSFSGKEIEKIMIEDSDLFGKGYGMVSKNIDAKVIDKVEVLQKYSDSPRLKGLEYSDKVALNLTLKDEVSQSLFGNTLLGYNTSSNYEGRIVLMSVSKSYNIMLF